MHCKCVPICIYFLLGALLQIGMQHRYLPDPFSAPAELHVSLAQPPGASPGASAPSPRPPVLLWSLSVWSRYLTYAPAAPPAAQNVPSAHHQTPLATWSLYWHHFAAPHWPRATRWPHSSAPYWLYPMMLLVFAGLELYLFPARLNPINKEKSKTSTFCENLIHPPTYLLIQHYKNVGKPRRQIYSVQMRRYTYFIKCFILFETNMNPLRSHHTNSYAHIIKKWESYDLFYKMWWFIAGLGLNITLISFWYQII